MVLLAGKPLATPGGTRRWRLAGLLVLVLCLGLVLFRDAPGEFLVLRDPDARVDAAIVLAGDPDYERTEAGSEMVLRGQARLLVLTGGQAGPGDSARSLFVRAISLGVEKERIRMETVSRSTRESFLALRPILAQERVKSAALVTSPYHQRRAFLAAKKALPGIQILNHPAAHSSWTPRGWWKTPWSRGVVVSEYVKLVYYSLRGWS